MSADSLSPLAGTQHLENEDLDHRAAFVDYVLEHAEEWHRAHLTRLYMLWEDWNGEHFDSQLWPPYIELLEPPAPTVYGSCAPVSGFGGKLGIRLRPSLLTGTHPHMRHGLCHEEGRVLFVADVLLHEMIHQWQQEVSGDTDEGYHGHGPAFRDKANEIGAKLGLGQTRTSKKRGKDKALPSCSQWPHNVRPEGYYLGAYVPARRDTPRSVAVPTNLDGAVIVLRQHFDVGELCKRLQVKQS